MSTAETNWPHKSDIVVNPAKRKKLVVGVLVMGGFALLAFNQDNIVNHFVTGYKRDLLLPEMSALAARGKPDAVVWMMLNNREFREADPQYKALRKAAEAGNPHSMYLYAKVLKFQKDDDGAKTYIARAAAEGYPDAVLDLAEEAK